MSVSSSPSIPSDSTPVVKPVEPAKVSPQPVAPTRPGLKHWHMVAGVIVALLVIIAVASVTYALGSWQRISVKPNVSDQVSAGPTPTPAPEAPFAVALLGYGGGNHAGGKLTDTMLVAYIEPALKSITLISIPRDSWLTIPIAPDEGIGTKINAAYAIGSDDRRYSQKPARFTGEAGGGELAKFALSQVMGIPIDKFVSINFAGFEKSIDVLGGVSVNVATSFEDPWYPIEGKEEDSCGKSEEEIAAITATLSAEQAQHEFTCRFETLSFARGKVQMDGATALKFVRSRHAAQDGNDFGRSARQRNLLIAVRDKIMSIGFVPKIIPFLNQMSADVRTDFTLPEIQQWLNRAQELSEYEIKQVALTEKNILQFGRSPDGQFIVMPRAGYDQWPAVHAWLELQLHPVASESATPASTSAQPSVKPSPALQGAQP